MKNGPIGWGSRIQILSAKEPDREFNRSDPGFSAFGRLVFRLRLSLPQKGTGRIFSGLSNKVNVEARKAK